MKWSHYNRIRDSIKRSIAGDRLDIWLDVNFFSDFFLDKNSVTDKELETFLLFFKSDLSIVQNSFFKSRLAYCLRYFHSSKQLFLLCTFYSPADLFFCFMHPAVTDFCLDGAIFFFNVVYCELSKFFIYLKLNNVGVYERKLLNVFANRVKYYKPCVDRFMVPLFKRIQMYESHFFSVKTRANFFFCYNIGVNKVHLLLIEHVSISRLCYWLEFFKESFKFFLESYIFLFSSSLSKGLFITFLNNFRSYIFDLNTKFIENIVFFFGLLRVNELKNVLFSFILLWVRYLKRFSVLIYSLFIRIYAGFCCNKIDMGSVKTYFISILSLLEVKFAGVYSKYKVWSRKQLLMILLFQSADSFSIKLRNIKTFKSVDVKGLIRLDQLFLGASSLSIFRQDLVSSGYLRSQGFDLIAFFRDLFFLNLPFLFKFFIYYKFLYVRVNIGSSLVNIDYSSELVGKHYVTLLERVKAKIFSSLYFFDIGDLYIAVSKFSRLPVPYYSPRKREVASTVEFFLALVTEETVRDSTDVYISSLDWLESQYDPSFSSAHMSALLDSEEDTNEYDLITDSDVPVDYTESGIFDDSETLENDYDGLFWENYDWVSSMDFVWSYHSLTERFLFKSSFPRVVSLKKRQAKSNMELDQFLFFKAFLGRSNVYVDVSHKFNSIFNESVFWDTVREHFAGKYSKEKLFIFEEVYKRAGGYWSEDDLFPRLPFEVYTPRFFDPKFKKFNKDSDLYYPEGPGHPNEDTGLVYKGFDFDYNVKDFEQPNEILIKEDMSIKYRAYFQELEPSYVYTVVDEEDFLENAGTLFKVDGWTFDKEDFGDNEYVDDLVDTFEEEKKEEDIARYSLHLNDAGWLDQNFSWDEICVLFDQVGANVDEFFDFIAYIWQLSVIYNEKITSFNIAYAKSINFFRLHWAEVFGMFSDVYDLYSDFYNVFISPESNVYVEPLDVFINMVYQAGFCGENADETPESLLYSGDFFSAALEVMSKNYSFDFSNLSFSLGSRSQSSSVSGLNLTFSDAEEAFSSLSFLVYNELQNPTSSSLDYYVPITSQFSRGFFDPEYRFMEIPFIVNKDKADIIEMEDPLMAPFIDPLLQSRAQLKDSILAEPVDDVFERSLFSSSGKGPYESAIVRKYIKMFGIEAFKNYYRPLLRVMHYRVNADDSKLYDLLLASSYGSRYNKYLSTALESTNPLYNELAPSPVFCDEEEAVNHWQDRESFISVTKRNELVASEQYLKSFMLEFPLFNKAFGWDDENSIYKRQFLIKHFLLLDMLQVSFGDSGRFFFFLMIVRFYKHFMIKASNLIKRPSNFYFFLFIFPIYFFRVLLRVLFLSAENFGSESYIMLFKLSRKVLSVLIFNLIFSLTFKQVKLVYYYLMYLCDRFLSFFLNSMGSYESRVAFNKDYISWVFYFMKLGVFEHFLFFFRFIIGYMRRISLGSMFDSSRLLLGVNKAYAFREIYSLDLSPSLRSYVTTIISYDILNGKNFFVRSFDSLDFSDWLLNELLGSSIVPRRVSFEETLNFFKDVDMVTFLRNKVRKGSDIACLGDSLINFEWDSVDTRLFAGVTLSDISDYIPEVHANAIRLEAELSDFYSDVDPDEESYSSFENSFPVHDAFEEWTDFLLEATLVSEPEDAVYDEAYQLEEHVLGDIDGEVELFDYNKDLAEFNYDIDYMPNYPRYRQTINDYFGDVDTEDGDDTPEYAEYEEEDFLDSRGSSLFGPVYEEVPEHAATYPRGYSVDRFFILYEQLKAFKLRGVLKYLFERYKKLSYLQLKQGTPIGGSIGNLKLDLMPIIDSSIMPDVVMDRIYEPDCLTDLDVYVDLNSDLEDGVDLVDPLERFDPVDLLGSPVVGVRGEMTLFKLYAQQMDFSSFLAKGTYRRLYMRLIDSFRGACGNSVDLVAKNTYIWFNKEDLLFHKYIQYYFGRYFTVSKVFNSGFLVSSVFISHLLRRIRLYIEEQKRSVSCFVGLYGLLGVNDRYNLLKSLFVLSDSQLDLYIYAYDLMVFDIKFYGLTFSEIFLKLKKYLLFANLFGNELSPAGYVYLESEVSFFMSLYPRLDDKTLWLRVLCFKDRIKLEEFCFLKHRYSLFQIMLKDGSSAAVVHFSRLLKYKHIKDRCLLPWYLAYRDFILEAAGLLGILFSCLLFSSDLTSVWFSADVVGSEASAGGYVNLEGEDPLRVVGRSQSVRSDYRIVRDSAAEHFTMFWW